MPSPNGRKGPKTKAKTPRKGPPSAPGHMIGALPLAQQRIINRARHEATLERLRKELDRCYTIGPHGQKIIWKREDAAAIRKQMEAIRQMLEESG